MVTGELVPRREKQDEMFRSASRLVGLLICLILLGVVGSCFVYVNSENRGLQARRAYWHKQLDQLVHNSASPETSEQFFHQKGVQVDVSPIDPANGRFKLQVTDNRSYYTLLGPYERVMMILVYDRSRKPIGFTLIAKFCHRRMETSKNRLMAGTIFLARCGLSLGTLTW